MSRVRHLKVLIKKDDGTVYETEFVKNDFVYGEDGYCDIGAMTKAQRLTLETLIDRMVKCYEENRNFYREVVIPEMVGCCVHNIEFPDDCER